MINRTFISKLKEAQAVLENTIEKIQQIMSLESLLSTTSLDETQYDLPSATKQLQSALMLAKKDASQEAVQYSYELLKKAKLTEEAFQKFAIESAQQLEDLLDSVEQVKELSEEEFASSLSKHPALSKMIDNIDPNETVSDEKFAEEFNRSRQLCYSLLSELGISSKNASSTTSQTKSSEVKSETTFSP